MNMTPPGLFSSQPHPSWGQTLLVQDRGPRTFERIGSEPDLRPIPDVERESLPSVRWFSSQPPGPPGLLLLGSLGAQAAQEAPASARGSRVRFGGAAGLGAVADLRPRKLEVNLLGRQDDKSPQVLDSV